MILSLLYWIILVLSLIGFFAPPTWPGGRYISGGSTAILFIIIGLKLFRVSLQ